MLNIRRHSALAALVIGLSACAGSPTTKSTGEYIDDAAITTRVKTAFVTDKQVKAAKVRVETFKGTVQLSGYADSRLEIERATQLASSIPGVKSVRNDIDLKAGPAAPAQ